jgi:hypothetical protein
MGVWGTPMGSSGRVPENFWVFGAIMSHFELFWGDIEANSHRTKFRRNFKKVRNNRKFMEEF